MKTPLGAIVRYASIESQAARASRVGGTPTGGGTRRPTVLAIGC